MSTGSDILIRPVVSEKSMKLFGQDKYTFIVNPTANKVEIKRAVEETFKVTVVGVNTIIKKGRVKRGGPGGIGRQTRAGRTADVKKAVITLKPGDKIEAYQGLFG